MAKHTPFTICACMQAMRGFSLPFPLNILLLPFRIAEWALFYMISYR